MNYISRQRLVAPLFAGEEERQVVLPQGKWYDFYTGKYVGEGEVITVKPGLDKIPVYVKDGGIIPLWPKLTKVDAEKHPIEIRYYGAKPSIYELYDDDGETYDYEKGEYLRIPIEVRVDSEGKKKGEVRIPEGKSIWSYGDFSFKFMTK